MTDNRPHKIFNVIVACGTAIATSTHVSIKLKEEMEKRGKKINTIQTRVQEIPNYMDGADAIIATAQVPFETDVPVFNGIPFLTGIGLEEVLNNIDKALE